MNQLKVIGVAGQMRAAKDSVADYLAKKMQGWKRGSFAGNVKKILCDTFNVDLDFIEKWKVSSEVPPEFSMNIRQALQFIGDGFRKIRNDIWIDLFFKDLKEPKIISDCRYFNELKKIKEHNGLTILLWRKGWENNDPNGSEAQILPLVKWFESTGLEGDVMSNLPDEFKNNTPEGAKYVDYFIRNEGTLEDLYKKCDLIIDDIKSKCCDKECQCH